MAQADHKKYLISCPNPAAVANAIRHAQQMLAQAQRQLQPVIGVPEDERLWTPVHRLLIDMFKVQPGLQSSTQVNEIKERFRRLAQGANNLKTFCVSDAHPMCRTVTLGHSAFADLGMDRTPSAYLCPAFFRLNSPAQARTIVHELAHACLAVEHKGGEFVSFEPCGSSPLKTYDEAINNAYTFDLFADCAASR